MEINDILKLIEAVSEHGLTSFVLEEDGKKLVIKKKKETIVTTNTMIPAAGFYPAGAEILAAAGAAENGAQTEPVHGAVLSIDSDKVVISPLVGTFYDSPSPEAGSFVQVGDSVKKGQVLGIIEAMKLMNEIESEFDGIVEAILVKSEEVVEYGQPLFRIR